MFVAVAPADARSIPELEPGDRADVTGIVRPLPSASEARARWNLGADLARQLEGEPVYVEALSVRESECVQRTAGRTAAEGRLNR